jgi:hypothetical protein
MNYLLAESEAYKAFADGKSDEPPPPKWIVIEDLVRRDAYVE